jgi:hypothetical protein
LEFARDVVAIFEAALRSDEVAVPIGESNVTRAGCATGS